MFWTKLQIESSDNHEHCNLKLNYLNKRIKCNNIISKCDDAIFTQGEQYYPTPTWGCAHKG